MSLPCPGLPNSDRDQGHHALGQRGAGGGQDGADGDRSDLEADAEPLDGVDEPLTGDVDGDGAREQQQDVEHEEVGPLCRAAGKVSAPRGWQTSTHGSVWTADSGSKVSPTPHPQVSGPVTGETSLPVCRPTGFRGLLPFNGSKPYPRAGSRVEPACSPTGMAPPTDATAGTGAVPRSGRPSPPGRRLPVVARRGPVGQPAAFADLPHPLLGAAARLRGGDDEQLVPAPQRGAGGRARTPLSSRTTRVTLAPAGSRSSNSSTPCIRESGPICTCSRSAPSSLQRGGLDLDVDGVGRLG